MKIILLLAICLIGLVAANSRSKRQAYVLPDGAEILIGPVKSSFQCSQDGYYADVDNACKLFHVCHTATHADGNVEIRQFSFLCGNQTVFNQLTFTCAYPDEAIPCNAASDFFYLNARLGHENEFFHVEADLQKAAPLLASVRQVGRLPVASPGGARLPGRGG